MSDKLEDVPIVDLLKPSRHYLRGFDRRNHDLRKLLIIDERRPKYNWRVRFLIGRSIYETAGGLWSDSFKTVIGVLRANGVSGSEAVLIAGATLNYNFLKWVDADYRMVDPDSLLKICKAVTIGEKDGALEENKGERKEYRSPEKTGPTRWKYLGDELSHESVTADWFYQLCQRELEKLDLDKNPSRGCWDCHKHFKKALESFPKSGSIQEIQKWLLTTHNLVRSSQGKRAFRWSEAVNYYGW